MVEEMVRAAKARRTHRAIGAFVLGLGLCICFFNAFLISFLGGTLLSAFVYIHESEEVARVMKIQKPWREEDGR